MRKRYKNLSKEEKVKMQKKARDRYKNLSEEEQQKSWVYEKLLFGKKSNNKSVGDLGFQKAF